MSQQALSDVTVLDFTQLVQGPFATQKLADMGADVIKIERRETGEYFRKSPKTFLELDELIGEDSPYFHSVNRNKRSLTLDLKSDRGRDIALQLGEQADVVVNNFRPDVMDRLGLGYEDFREVNEGIVFCEGTGYGSSGPNVDKPGQDLLLQSMTGIARYTGTQDNPPTACSIAIVDEHAAMQLAFGAMVALYHRERTGEGQRVEVSLFDAAIDLQVQELTTFMNTDLEPQRSETGISQLWQAAPYGIYEAEDGYLAISTADLTDLADLLDKPELLEYKGQMFEKRDELKREIEQITPTKTVKEWLDVLEPADMWCAPVQSYDDLVENPQVAHNDMIRTVEHPDLGEIQLTGVPVKLSETPGRVEDPAPTVGEHTAEILVGLGYSEREVEELRSNRIV